LHRYHLEISAHHRKAALTGAIRKAWLFCGSDRRGQRAAIMFSLIQSCRINDLDPQAWLADVLARIAGHPANRLGDLLPWNWKPTALKLEP
jgi:hypothetical protein